MKSLDGLMKSNLDSFRKTAAPEMELERTVGVFVKRDAKLLERLDDESCLLQRLPEHAVLRGFSGLAFTPGEFRQARQRDIVRTDSDKKVIRVPNDGDPNLLIAHELAAISTGGPPMMW